MKNKNYRELLIMLVTVWVLSTSGLLGQSIGRGRPESAPNGKVPAYVAPGSRAVGCNDGWDTTFTTNGANNDVEVIVSDGVGNYYVGGDFTSMQGVPANGIVKWDGTTWTSLGTGVSGGVNAIAISGSDIYVGGGFSTAGGNPAKNVAKWNGSSWSALGAGLGGGTHDVRAIALLGSDVYFGGNFSTSDGSPATGMARWDGTSWSAVGSGPVFAPSANSIVVNGGMVYAGGDSGGVRRWDGVSWTMLGTMTGSVNDLGFSGNDLWAVGTLIFTGPNDLSQVVKWNGTAWTKVGFFNFNSTNYSLAFNGSDLYVGGNFTRAGGQYITDGIVKYNGTTWTEIGTGTQGGSHQVNTLLMSGNTLYVGGDFLTANGAAARNIAKLTVATSAWEGFAGTGIDSSANAIAVSGTDVYVGGSFTSAGPITANKIAKWNSLTNAWSALGSGVSADNTSIAAIAVAGNKIYAGGTFSSIGGVSANNIAVWNGTNWAALGTGVNAFVSVIIVRGDDVYVGGSFSTAGSLTANRVAKWNGTSWSGLNSTIIPNTVSGMAFMGNDLYVGTGTTTVANPAYFTKYDGTTWTALGADLGDRGVSSIAVLGSDVYVAGGFTTVNGVTVNRIVKWNGTSFSALGNGLPSPLGNLSSVRLTVSGTDLIAIGDFTAAPGGPADRIARWNGTSWSGLSTGLDATGSTVMSAGGDIFVGGGFTTAGCNLSPYFARWRQLVWTGSTNSDWHTAANWGGGSIPAANAGVTIVSSDASISSADVTLSSLIITGGRTLTIGAGRTLTVTGKLDLSNGSLSGPGTLVVNGDLSLTSGNITGLATVTVNGNLYLSNGIIAGSGAVALTSCRASALSGGNSNSYVSASFSRCVNSAGTYRFPVGSNGVYAPVELAGISGSGAFTVEPKSGAYSGAATGLPANRLQRWWNLTGGGISQADLTFYYSDAEVVGIEGRYRAYRIDAGTPQLIPTVLTIGTNKAVVAGVTSFSAWTLAQGPATFETLNGRITTPQGRSAERVIVTLTDEFGNVRYGLTNNFGYYRFFNVETWKTYTIQLQSKKYTFQPPNRTLEFPESSAGVNFVSTDH